MDKKFGFIGGGNMAKAIVQGMISKNLTSYSNIHVSVVRDESVKYWSKLGVNATTNNRTIVEESDIIFIAVKPHMLSEAISQIRVFDDRFNTAYKLFVSILAGVTISTLEEIFFDFAGPRIIRVMPNTPLAVGQGAVVYSAGEKATPDDLHHVEKIFSTSGICKLVPESLIDPISAIAGSGPAYIYLIIEALADGAVKMGVPRQLAIEFAAQTVYGSGKMVLESGKHPAVLKDEVCSPGGSTIVAIHALEKGAVRSSLMEAVEVACRRCQQLGEK